MKGSSCSPKYSEPNLPLYIHELTLCKKLVEDSEGAKAKSGCRQVMLQLQDGRQASLQGQEQCNHFALVTVILHSGRKI